MIGAVLTHLLIVGGNPAIALVLLIAMSIVAVGRKDRTLALIRRDSF